MRLLAADAGASKGRDVFISHATEDKEAVALPLAHALQEHGISVWYDEFELRIGDSLRQRIDDGIACSRFGLVILSKPFFAKEWPQYELDGLVAQVNSYQKPLLPIWHKISKDDIIARSPSLANIVARRTSDRGIAEIAKEIASVIVPVLVPPVMTDTKPLPPTRTSPRGRKNVTLTAGPNRHFFSGVTVSPHSDRHGRYFLDVRKIDISRDDYVSLCDDLATTLGTGGWRAHLSIDGMTFAFDCEVTPKDTPHNRYYVDVRAHTDASGYQQVMEALAAIARSADPSPTEKEREKRELEQHRLAKEQKERDEEREEERQRCRQQFRVGPTTNWVYLPPETEAGQVIVGSLSDGYPHWKLMEERVRGDVVNLRFAVKATSLGRAIVRKPEDGDNELGPAERAARKFHSGAEVTQGRFVDDPTIFGSLLFGYVLVRIKVSNVPN